MAYFHLLKIFHLFGFPSWKSSDPSKMCFSLIFKHKYSYSIARSLITAMLPQCVKNESYSFAIVMRPKMRFNWRAIPDEIDHVSERSR